MVAARRSTWIGPLLRVILAIVVTAVVLGVGASYIVSRWAPHTRGSWLARAQRYATSTKVYWKALQTGPIRTDHLIELMDAVALGQEDETPGRKNDDDRFDYQSLPKAAPIKTPGMISDADIARLLEDPRLSAQTRILAQFWRQELARPNETPEDPDSHVTKNPLTPEDKPSNKPEPISDVEVIEVPPPVAEVALVDPLRAQVMLLAATDPPTPMANHLLARSAVFDGNFEARLRYLRREALYFGDRHLDATAGCEMLAAAGAWSRAANWILDPAIGKHVRGGCMLQVMMHQRRFGKAFRGAVREVLSDAELPAVIMTVAAGLGWLAFAAQLGGLRRRPRLRIPLYLGAVALGIVSIAPTLFLVEAQSQFLHLEPNGKPFHDLVFFVFGVGFREEISKLLLFAPLLPIIRKYGSRQDVFVTGSLVGLGFAIEENLGYFAQGDFSDGIGRFLTANFLHMSMTALAAGALDDFVASPSKKAADASLTLFMIMGLHGIYDFFIINRTYGDLGYLAMVVFVVLAQRFLKATAPIASGSANRAVRHALLRTFAVSTAVTTGVTFAVAAALVGPYFAFVASFEGLLGVGFISVMFVRGLRE